MNLNDKIAIIMVNLMKKGFGNLKFFFLILIFLVLISNIACETPETKEPTKKEAIDETQETGKVFESRNFAIPEVCGSCHDEIYNQWQGSIHNKAYEDEIYLKIFEIGSKETKGKIDEFCIACHSPIAFITKEIPPFIGRNISEISKKGIQCDFCHTVDKALGIGNYQYHSMPGKIKRGPFKDSVTPIHETAYSELHTKSEFCGMCHDVNHPENGLPLEATYSEWKKGPYSKEGVQCQDCHMTPGPGVTKPNPGKAAWNGPDREHIFTHYFVGGNAVLAKRYGSDLHSQKAIERLKHAASIKVSPTGPLAIGQANIVEVRITNKGAGHYIPTGITELREMWIELIVTDGNGKEIYHEGAIDINGDIDSKAVVFNTKIADKKGKETHKVWEAEKIIYDKRIPPKETVTEKRTFNIPAGSAKPIKVTAFLKYRSINQHFVDELLGKGKIDIPEIVMTKHSTLLK